LNQATPGHNRPLAILGGILFIPFAIFTLGLVIFMNRSIPELEKAKTVSAIEFTVNRPKPKKKEKPKQVKRTPPKRSQARPLTPPPDLGVSFSGVDFGLPEFSFGGVAQITDEMIGDMDNLLMTSDAVDSKPVVKYRPPLNYPPRARANNVSGRVKIWFIVAVDGTTKNIKVQESVPEGVFDTEAINNVKGTRFEPAKYKGRPVETSVVIPLNFQLN
jgi:protein TonB